MVTRTMRFRASLSMAAIMLSAAAVPCAAQHLLDEDGVPAVIAQSVAKQVESCKGDISALPQSLFSIDLNGDGRLDYVVNFEDLFCEIIPSPFCGTGGCLHEIWLSDDQGWKLALSPHAGLLAGVDMIGGKPALRLLVHVRYCEREPCYQNIVWSGQELSVVEVK